MSDAALAAASIAASPDYSVIIPAYNEEQFLPATLASVQAAMQAVADLRGELIVTDNNSTDQTAAVAARAGARVVAEPHRQIARARNTGAAASRGRFLVFVDADTLITPQLLAAALAALAGPGCCGGGTTVTFDDDEKAFIRYSARAWTALSRTFKWACGAFVFCRRDAFEAIGGFDERYYASEEIHLSRALSRWGRRHGMKMRILNLPIRTSVRKLHWFGVRRMLAMMGKFVCCPWLVRDRKHCWLWYERPQG